MNIQKKYYHRVATYYCMKRVVHQNPVTSQNSAYSILRNETKRNETKYMGEGEKMLINLNTA